MDRVNRILDHQSNFDDASDRQVILMDTSSFESVDDPSEQLLKWNGWGYSDTKFLVNETGDVELTGSRYLYSGKMLPSMRPWFESALDIRIDEDAAPQTLAEMTVDSPNVEKAFYDALLSNGISKDRISFKKLDRVHHSHGNSFQEMFMLRHGRFPRLVDLVVWPTCHDEVVRIVEIACKFNVVLIPFGGGTTVTHSLLCPENEKRTMVSVDLKLMDKIKWIDYQSMEVCIEAGKIGMDIEKELNEKGYCLGHEPDSAEFSTLGGWVATRASGMKKNKYGNIEDLIIHITFVTPSGVIQKSSHGPRQSTGPDINHIILGSEGTFGIVTEVVLKLSKLPECTEYGSFIFPDFESGVRFMNKIGLLRAAPASIRLVDNMQFQFGQTLKPASEGWSDELTDKVKKWFVTELLSYDPNRMSVATIVYEGSPSLVHSQQSKVKRIAKEYNGFSAGAENGRRGFFLTYMIAYLRDLGLNYRFMSESFETSVSWKNVSVLCSRVKQCIHLACKAKGFTSKAFATCRVTQVYDTGACIYFYFGVKWDGPADPFKLFGEIEDEAREEVLRCGGSLSHHHGVGKLRKKWMTGTNSIAGMKVLKAMKFATDPQNIFASDNLL